MYEIGNIGQKWVQTKKNWTESLFNAVYGFQPFKRQPHKMIKHIHTVRRGLALKCLMQKYDSYVSTDEFDNIFQNGLQVYYSPLYFGKSKGEINPF